MDPVEVAGIENRWKIMTEWKPAGIPLSPPKRD